MGKRQIGSWRPRKKLWCHLPIIGSRHKGFLWVGRLLIMQQQISLLTVAEDLSKGKSIPTAGAPTDIWG
jgi:hypothetical protein